MTYDSDLAGASALAVALEWLESAILGTVAIAIAIVTVAWLGLMMLTGRIPVRRAAQIILGCFVVFGASTIAAGIQRGLQGSDASFADTDISPGTPIPASVPTAVQAPLPDSYDPYAGAAIQPRP